LTAPLPAARLGFMKTGIDLVDRIHEARRRIAPYARVTPLEFSRELSQQTGARVFLKLENYQTTGSFKLRGALNKLLSLSPEQKRRGITAASTGNHGAAVAHCLSLFGIDGSIFVGENALASKVEAIRRRGADLQTAGKSCEEAEAIARRRAAEEGRTFVSPYNDWDVIAGQGTIGLELLDQGAEQGSAEWDAVFVAMGGGGLIGGIGAALKSKLSCTRVYGVSPRNDAALAASLEAGELVSYDARPTLSDATAGGLEPGCVTFPLCQAVIDETVLVDEEAIERALRWLLEVPHVLVEGAAAVALAGFLQVADRLRGKNVAIVLCGANIGSETLKRVLQ